MSALTGKKVTLYERDEDGEKMEIGYGTFLEFIASYRQYDQGDGYTWVSAIISREDGSIESLPIDLIKLDNPI